MRFAGLCRSCPADDLDALGVLVQTMRQAGVIGDLDALAEADVRFHELVIERSGQQHCLQIWRSIQPRVRAYFRRDAPIHSRRMRLLTSMRSWSTFCSEATRLNCSRRCGDHICNFLAPPIRGFRMTGQTVLVTGAGSGIGAAVALAAARQGAGVAALDIDAGRLERVTADAAQAGAKDVLALEADVRCEQAVEEALIRCRERLGVPQRCSRMRGSRINAAAHELSLADWNRTLEVNLTGAFLTARYAIREMLRAGSGGSVVCTSSPSAFVGFAGGHNAAYAASKGGISAMVRSLALDYASAGIRVNGVVPGATDTPLLTVAAPAEKRIELRDRIVELARSSKFRSGGWARPMRWRTACCGCGPMPPHMSLAPIWSSTAAFSPRALTTSDVGCSIATIREEPGLDAVGGHWTCASGGDLQDLVSMTAGDRVSPRGSACAAAVPTGGRAQVGSVAPRRARELDGRGRRSQLAPN